MRITQPKVHTIPIMSAGGGGDDNNDNNSPPSPQSLRIATLNVHNFVDAQMRPNLHRLIHLIQPLHIDVLSLNEVWIDSHIVDDRDENFMYELRQLALHCGFRHFVFGVTEFEEYGNAILSRYEICRAVNVQSTKIAGSGTRGMLIVQLSTLPHAVFCSTHLDHVREENRVAQWNEFVTALSILTEEEANNAHGSIKNQLVTNHRKKVVESTKERMCRLHLSEWKQSPSRISNTNTASSAAAAAAAAVKQVFVLGDFNALTQTDYSPRELDYITRVRAKGSWELPQFALMNQIEHMRFDDVLRSVLRRKKQYNCSHEYEKEYAGDGYTDDAHTNASTTRTTKKQRMTTEREHEQQHEEVFTFALSTCRFDTRIDYILNWNNSIGSGASLSSSSSDSPSSSSSSSRLRIHDACIVNSRDSTDHHMVLSDLHMSK